MLNTQIKSPVKRLSIINKLLIVFVAFILIPMAYFNYVELIYMHHLLFKSQLSKLNAIAELKAGQIEMYFKHMDLNVVAAKDFLNVKKNMPILIAYNNDKNNPKYIAAKHALDNQLITFQKTNLYDDFMLLTTEGELVYISNPNHNFEYKPSWAKRMAEDILTKSKNGIYHPEVFQYSEEAKDSGIIAGAIAHDEQGKEIGVIVIETNMFHIYPVILDEVNFGKTGETFIVEKQGNTGLVLNPLRFDKNAAFNMRIDLEKLENAPGKDVKIGRQGVAYTDYRNIQTVLVWRHINVPSINWDVVVKLDVKEIFESDLGFEDLFWVLVGVTLLVGVLVAFAIAKSIAGPIDKLRKGAEIVGGGNLDYKVGTKVQDEVGDLSRTFDAMVSNLKKKNEDLTIAKQKAEELSQAKSDFLAMMSHELRTPLNAIIGFSEILVDEGVGKLNEKQKEYVTDVLNSGHHLLSLINNVLDVKRIESGRMVLRLKESDVKSMVDSSMLMVKEKADKHNIELIENIEENIGSFMIDEVRIKQIMYNLLSNAVKFTPDGGKVGIDVEKIGNVEILVTVWDTGIGIEEKDREKIFAAFKQIDSELNRKYEGTGLGLTLSKKIIELHGGKIWFESEGKNKGSKFSFTIPIKQKGSHA